MQAFYFGTRGRAGHFLWNTRLTRLTWPRHSESLDPDDERNQWPEFPWKRIDNALNPSLQVEGVANLHHRDGWTALAFANRTDDNRPGSNSVFIFDKYLNFDQAVEAAKKYFPSVVERFEFNIVQSSELRS